ncbi:MAG: hypothetical protein HY901_09475 [Deltaproteobacteria bacterium]|nr:hypothetical protein [Deltaproteobacteria bacterium]
MKHIVYLGGSVVTQCSAEAGSRLGRVLVAAALALICSSGPGCSGGDSSAPPDVGGAAPSLDAGSCPAGLGGCPCRADGSCIADDDVCASGVCQSAGCAAGATGCPCQGGGACASPDDECQGGLCQPLGCAPGTLNCSCAGGACQAGLACKDGKLCVDNAGYLGGPCLADGTCRTSLLCQNEICVPCRLGSKGCACVSSGSCDPGLDCVQQLCMTAPKCWTPCQSDLVASDGTFRPCGADGLLEGCVGGFQCVQGSCVEAGGSPAACASDLDCPEHQACIHQQCMSNCEVDGDCAAGRVCHQRACRQPCDAAAASCAQGFSCVTNDGAHGGCLPVAAPGSTDHTSVNAGFHLSREALEFSNFDTRQTIKIVNDGETFERFVVRKRAHAAYAADATSTELDDPAGDGRECVPATDCPLTWVTMGEAGKEALVQSFEVGVEGHGGEVEIVLAGAGDTTAVRWNGRLEISHPQAGTRTLVMTYSERPEGRWTGNLYYFSQFGESGLSDWLGDKASYEKRQQLGNAFLQEWAAFRTGNASYKELQAALTATRVESWRWPTVTKACKAMLGHGNGACFPYDENVEGVRAYSTDRQNFPIPTGVVELPFSLNLRVDPDDSKKLVGRIESSVALQFAGAPAIDVAFESDPTGCMLNAQGACLVFVRDLAAQVHVGGRYESTSADVSCSKEPANSGYVLSRVPWLLPGFERMTELDDTSGLRYRYECRDATLPFRYAQGNLDDALKAKNASLAVSNPIPDGRLRRRTLSVVDGALINQSSLFLVVKETFESFLPDDAGSPFAAYGVVILDRQKTDLDDADANSNSVPDVFEGQKVSDTRPAPAPPLLDVTCSADLLAQIPQEGGPSLRDPNRVVEALIDGVVTGGGGSFIDPATSDEAVHYLCVANGLFDGGAGARTSCHGGTQPPNDDSCPLYADNDSCDDGGPGSRTSICELGTDKTDCAVNRAACDVDQREACPPGSEVIYFTVDKSRMSQDRIAALPCQTHAAGSAGTCQAVLNQWQVSSDVLVQKRPAWRCADPNRVYCDDNRLDLRDGKRFFALSQPEAVFQPLYAEIDSAFRYKTQFVSRTGQSVGFTPQVCIPDSNQIPYCYDPSAIEASRARVECLMSIWRTRYAQLDAGNQAKLNTYLCTNFSFAENCRSGMDPAFTHYGFERLYAELLVMLGDESLTQAFASRFDLAGSRSVSFEGTLFEPNGINLSGVPGREMHLLYQAAQYYQEALDHFYSMSPVLKDSLDEAMHLPATKANFVTAPTVTTYFDRLIGASTQKARAWSQVATRYQSFHRPDLARAVIERAYTATYLESVVLGRLMLRIVDTLKPEDRPQVVEVLERGQKRYRMAMLDMRNVYSAITDSLDFFGLAPDYIPFPALGANDQNAFEVILARAKAKTSVANLREDEALANNRAFETDAAQFQAELVRLRTTYESQIGDLCGTFTGSDGRIYPAIARYAYLNEKAQKLEDPCGLMGNGAISNAMGQFEVTQVDLKRILTAYDNVLNEVAIEQARVEAQCNLTLTMADFKFVQQGKITDLQTAIRWSQFAVRQTDRLLNTASTIAGLGKCMIIAGVSCGSDCPTAAASTVIYGIAVAAANIGIAITEGAIAGMEQGIASIERDTARWEMERQCDAAAIDSNARMATTLLRLKEIDLEGLKAQYQVAMALADITRMLNQAKRLEQELDESEQHAINIQAARNDPNVRIYRNDAYLNADVTFDDAMREAYRATRVFEYYTSQTWAKKEQLYLIRMVQYGDYNLENYLLDLENAFYDFEEQYGLPDTRVAILSMRDDILGIPRIDETGRVLDQAERIEQLRRKLTDPALLDRNGYLAVPFSTSFKALSPLTRNHKIAYLEAEIIGSGVGDTVGRLYVNQQGTSAVRGVAGDYSYYRFPEHLAVLNPFFNGNRVFSAEIYKNQRLRDRPYVNTSWELLLNQRDELANQDIDLNSLTDIRLYVYYTDFTRL